MARSRRPWSHPGRGCVVNGELVEVDPALVEVLLAALPPVFDHSEPREWMRGTAEHLARAVQGYVEGRVAAALEDAARRIDAHRDSQHDDPPIMLHGGVSFWVGDAFYDEAAEIVRSDARRSPLTASTPDGGRGGVRGGEGA